MLLLQNDSLDWALAHVNRYGDTDVFPVPFEYAAIEHDWVNVKTNLTGADVLQWTPVCKYLGTYGNRLKQRWVGQVEKVPWSSL